MDENLRTPEGKRNIEAWLWLEDQKRGRKICKVVEPADVIQITNRLTFESPKKYKVARTSLIR